MIKANVIRMPGKERPATSRLGIQSPRRRSLTIGISQQRETLWQLSPMGQPQRVSQTDSFGASPVSSALDHSDGRDPSGATTTIARIQMPWTSGPIPATPTAPCLNTLWHGKTITSQADLVGRF